MKSLNSLLTIVEKFPTIWSRMQDIDKEYLNKPLPDWKLTMMDKVSTALNEAIIELDANHNGDIRRKQAASAYLYFCAELYRDWEDDTEK